MQAKNFKSTKSLYGVGPEYFEEMKYFKAIREKVKLAKKKIKKINEMIDYNLPEVKYKDLCRQLNECERAREFNQRLLDEYKRSLNG